MRNYTLLLFITLLSIYNGYAQFSVIDDKSGYVSVRDKNNKVDKISSGDVVFSHRDKVNRASILYVKDDELKWGYVNSSGLVNIRSFKQIPMTTNEDGKAILSSVDVKVTLTQSPFDPQQHKITREPRYNSISHIDNTRVWGTDGELPVSQYSSVSVVIGKKTINLPAAAFHDLFNPKLFHTEVFYDAARRRVFITSLNSDGAGAYYVVWIIDKGVYKKRIIFHGF